MNEHMIIVVKRLTVEVTDLVGAVAGAVVTADGSGTVLAVPPVNSSVTAPNMETPPTGAFPFGLWITTYIISYTSGGAIIRNYTIYMHHKLKIC